jgi:HAD superfamily phosphatase (TIGR01681 family)
MKRAAPDDEPAPAKRAAPDDERAPAKRAAPNDDLVASLKRAGVACAVVDLDSTIWQGNIESYRDCRVLHSPTELHDPDSGRTLRLFPGVREFAAALRAADVPLAVASASPADRAAARALRLFGLTPVASRVRPGSKDAHLKEIASELNVPLRSMLFFDDLPHNIETVRKRCGCTCVHVTGGGGLSVAHLREGVKRMESSQKQASSFSSFFKKPKKEAGAPI